MTTNVLINKQYYSPTEEHQQKFISPATIILSGTTSSGKTTWVESFLRHQMLDIVPQQVFYCYGVYQKRFESLASKTNTNVELIQGLPESFERFCGGGGGGGGGGADGSNHNLIILDDLQDEVSNSKAVEKLFTRESHHKNLSVVYINQNIFYCGKNSRTIALNTHYTVLFRNPRSSSQLRALRSQTGLNHLNDAYDDVMKSQRFGYLVIDLSPYSKSDFRLRTGIFPDEHLIVYH